MAEKDPAALCSCLEETIKYILESAVNRWLIESREHSAKAQELLGKPDTELMARLEAKAPGIGFRTTQDWNNWVQYNQAKSDRRTEILSELRARLENTPICEEVSHG